MNIETIAVDLLIPYARNSRTHSDEQVAQIAASIREFGFTNPVLIDGQDGIIAGHGRVLGARKLGMSDVPCIRLAHLSEAQKRAYVIADNKLALNAGWDEKMLALELQDLQGMDFDLSLTGFLGNEIDELLAELDATPEGNTDADADNVPEALPNVITKPDDIWICGDHRVMCGDCRDFGAVQNLLEGSRINVAVTSPPYAEQREYDVSSGFKPIPPDEYVDWYADVAMNIMANIAEDGSYFCNIKPSASGLDTSLYVFDLVIAHVRKWGWHFATEFCWERSGIPKGVTRRFKNQFEPIYQFSKGDWKMRPDAVRHASLNVPKARGKGAGATSWAKHQGNESIHMTGHQGEQGFAWFGENVEEGLAYPGNRLPTFTGSHEALGHAAAFPVGLPEFFINAYSDNGDTVFDPFMGSGSTLMAAERTGRRGFGMELSPIYCDVIVRRWQQYTGKQAVHADTGKTFDETAAVNTEE